MKMQEDGVLLRIFAGDSDRFEGVPLYEVVVRKARELGLAGATVLKGSMGFGAHSVLHTAKVLELSADLPVVIEVVDTEEKVRRLLPVVDTMVQEGLITMEAVRIMAWRRQP
jgi:PII-like signaling protein